MLKRRRKLNLFDLKLFKEFLTSEDERRELQKIPAAKPQQFATKFVLGVRCQQGFHWHVHLSKVYISLPSWTVTLAARFTFWHKIYVNFKLNSSLSVHIVYKDITRRREDMNCIFDSTRRYELYFRLDLFSRLENKIYIFPPPCNILY